MPAHPERKAGASTGSSTTKPAHRGGSWGWGGEDTATAGGTNEGIVSDPPHRLVPGRLLGTLQTLSLDGMGLGVKPGAQTSMTVLRHLTSAVTAWPPARTTPG